MLQIVFLFTSKPYSLKNKQRLGYENLYTYARDYEVELLRAPLEEYDAQKKIFRRCQTFYKGRWIFAQSIKPHIVYDKTPYNLPPKKSRVRKKIAEDFIFINNIELSALCSNKWKTYTTFKELCPQTILLSSAHDIHRIRAIKSNTVIIKPVFGSGGQNISVQNKNNLNISSFPCIVQPYMDMPGIKNVISGQHDLRLLFLNENIFHAYIRTPPPGKNLANTSQGGRFIIVSVTDVPQSILEFAKKIDAELKKFSHRFYAMDFMLTDNGPLLIELNSRPGLDLEKEEYPQKERIFQPIITFFKNVARV